MCWLLCIVFSILWIPSVDDQELYKSPSSSIEQNLKWHCYEAWFCSSPLFLRVFLPPFLWYVFVNRDSSLKLAIASFDSFTWRKMQLSPRKHWPWRWKKEQMGIVWQIGICFSSGWIRASPMLMHLTEDEKLVPLDAAEVFGATPFFLDHCWLRLAVLFRRCLTRLVAL